MAALFEEGDVVAVAGRANSFQNRLQLVVEHLVPLPKEEVNLADFLPAAGGDAEAHYAQLLEAFRSLQNPWVRGLGLSLLEDPEIASRYKRCPAAKTIHHAYIGGLLVHSLQLIKVAEAVLPFYDFLNRDIVIFGAAFHDFGKIFELSFDGPFGYTDEGKLVGHITIGATLIDRKIQGMPGFPAELGFQLKHIVLAHHGRLEYGSPKRPQTLEAQFVHSLDDMDSKMNSISEFMRNERNASRWTAHHKAYDNYYYKPDHFLTLPGGHSEQPAAPRPRLE
jgi:3'-5' exoribonuclease